MKTRMKTITKSKTLKHSSRHNNSTSNKNISKLVSKRVIKLSKNKVELLLLFSTLINYYILLQKTSSSRITYKTKIINLLKDLRHNNKYISKDITDKELNAIYKSLENVFSNILKQIEHYGNTQPHKGGFYFKSLEDKGEKPITGTDLTKLLDEVQQFFYNAKYTSEGQHLQDTDTLLSMLRGDVNQFKGFLQYRIFPKYYTVYPPFLKWEGIKEAYETKKWEDIPDYLLAYQSYLRSRDEYDVERGLKSPAVLQKDLYTGFYNKMAHSLDTNIQQFQQYRNKYHGRYFPIAVPQ
jgi:hypothetical protein